jgi:WD repeat and SOF domain-containing protein 1
MKVQTLKRTVGNVERECSGDLRMHARNLDPQYHPMQRQREYTRALTSAKISRMFAHPLIGNIGHGHRDAVTCSAISRRSLLPFVSGSADGTIALWDLPSRTCVTMIQAHSRTVTDLTFDVMNGQSFYSCSDDGYVHKWSIHGTHQQLDSSSPSDGDGDDDNDIDTSSKLAAGLYTSQATRNKTKGRKSTPLAGVSSHESSSSQYGPIDSWRISGTFKSIDHHYQIDNFATASDDAVQIWTSARTSPLSTHSQLWGSDDTVTTVRYNPSETSILAHCSADRGIGLHDTRTNTALKKTILGMRSNDLQWNPMEPMVFVVGNEDMNAYTFDMRNLQRPTRIYKGHTSAIMSVSWSPTGREFVTGSYDRTIRIFPINSGTSRDIYHTKRMQRIFTVQYSLDTKFIVSGSDDSNLRIWKSKSNEQLGQLTSREEASQQYRNTIIQRYQHVPQIRTIVKSRKIPKVIQNQTHQFQIQKESQQRKQSNRVKYNNPSGSNDDTNQNDDSKPPPKHKFTPERDQIVVRQVE